MTVDPLVGFFVRLVDYVPSNILVTDVHEAKITMFAAQIRRLGEGCTKARLVCIVWEIHRTHRFQDLAQNQLSRL